MEMTPVLGQEYVIDGIPYVLMPVATHMTEAMLDATRPVLRVSGTPNGFVHAVVEELERSAPGLLKFLPGWCLLSLKDTLTKSGLSSINYSLMQAAHLHPEYFTTPYPDDYFKDHITPRLVQLQQGLIAPLTALLTVTSMTSLQTKLFTRLRSAVANADTVALIRSSVVELQAHLDYDDFSAELLATSEFQTLLNVYKSFK